MKQLTYSIRNLTKSPAQQIIKIISLTLGLAVGLLLFSRVAFDLSFDRFLPDRERIYQVGITYAPGSIPGYEGDMSDDRVGPAFALAMEKDFPQIEAATRFVRWNGGRIKKGETVYNRQVMMADTMLFDVLDLGMITGSPKDLQTAGDILLSRSFAEILFSGEDPLGKSLVFDDTTPLTVRGVYRDIPDNSHLAYEAILCIDIARQQWNINMENLEGGAFVNFFKLRPDADIRDIEQEMGGFYERHGLTEMIEAGDTIHFTPVTDIHLNGYGVKMMITLLSVVGFILLFIAALNYVLIAVSSLTKRARAIAVQKCNGASNNDILRIFLYETAFLLLFSLLLAILLICAFRGSLEMLTGESLRTLFAPERLVFLGGVVILVFIVSGFLPARLFSRIPVKDAFKVGGVSRKGWKQVLLFIQFAGVAFVFIFLLIVVRQYHYLLNKDLGYDHDRMVYAELQHMDKTSYQTLLNEWATLPFVEGGSLSSDYFFEGLGGYWVINPENEEIQFSARRIRFDHRTLPLFRIDMAAGENFTENTPANSLIVNEEFVRLMGWKDNPVGKTVLAERGRSMTIMGVTKDFQVSNTLAGLAPVAATPIQMRDSARYNYIVMARLNRITPENIEQLNNYLEQKLPEQQEKVKIYSEEMAHTYSSQRLFRNIVSTGAVVTFLIALMGLIGYVNDEARNRRREIAIRKINGAGLGDILWCTSRPLLWLSLLAVIPGAAAAWITGSNWLANFSNRVTLPFWVFIAGSLAVVCIILATSLLRSYRAANENPAHTIKTE